jgi:hypothetical protein
MDNSSIQDGGSVNMDIEKTNQNTNPNQVSAREIMITDNNTIFE